MLSFYINTGAERQARPPFSRLLTLKSCADFTHDALPLSRIYVSSSHYVGLLEQSLGRQSPTHERALSRLTEQDATHIASRPGFPRSFRNLGFESVTQLQAHVRQYSKNTYRPTFALINGIGTGLGDNYVGIGVLQRFIKLLAPLKPHFCLLQELEERIEPVYRSMPEVHIAPCFMPLSEFVTFDFYIDFSSIDNMPSLNDMAAAHFTGYAFSINKLLPNRDIQPKLTIDEAKTQALKAHIHQTLPADQLTVLLHPLASSNLRKLPSAKAVEITQQLVDSGCNVVSAFDHSHPPENFLSLSKQSNTIDDLLHIIDAVDAVVSVGTVVYHLASALGKPTLLLPTVQADIRSAELLPEVMAWLPDANQDLYPNLHKSEQPHDLAVAEQIWRNVHAQDVVNALGSHIRSVLNTPSADTLSKAPRIGVVIPHAPQTTQLAMCLDALTKVEGFDPQYLICVESHGLGHSHHRYTDAFNQGIRQALSDHCDYVCLLHENAAVPLDYFTRLLKHFDYSETVGIVSGGLCGLEFLYGSAHLLPDPLQSHTRLNSMLGLQQPWVSFSSCLIKTHVFQDIGDIDPRMQRLFGDVDFCVRAAQAGWQTWLDPTVNTMFNSNCQTSSSAKPTLRQSARVFYQKWGHEFNTTSAERIEQELLNYIGF